MRNLVITIGIKIFTYVYVNSCIPISLFYFYDIVLSATIRRKDFFTPK